MDLRRQEEERGSLSSPPTFKDSTFSRPILPLNSSLLHQSPKPFPNHPTTNGHYSLAPNLFNPTATTCHYRECQRNHAAGSGGHVIDGCCEFMPRDDVPLKCAACGCHRSFHRKEPANPSSPSNTNNGATANHSLPRVPVSSTDQSSSEELVHVSPSKKRFRTKFSSAQKEKMLEFSERLGCKFQKIDDVAIDEFCKEAGVSRQVFKVWMHNNKYAYKKQEQPQVVIQHEEPHQEDPQKIP